MNKDSTDQTLVERLREKTSGAGTEITAGQQPIATVAAMLAAQAKAAVEARFIMAMNRPRSWDDVRVKLLAECRRPGFAQNKSVYYHKPIGGGVDGLGIRFVEAALRCMHNVLVEQINLHDDERIRLIEVRTTDLETNETIGKVITLNKTVERSRPLDDGTFLSVRTNTQGKKTYTVTASDDDLLNKEGALVSKAIRVLGLRMLPGDIQDECEKEILAIRKDTAAKDPAAERKRIADAFFSLNVMPSDLSAYLGHDFGACSPAELVKLRGVYGAIDNGETTWAAVLENAQDEKREERQKNGQQGSKDPPPQWPHLGPDGLWRDSTGADYQPTLHGWNVEEKRPSVTSAGVFRARRGAGEAEKKPPATSPTSGPGTTAAHERAAPAQQQRERGEHEEEGW